MKKVILLWILLMAAGTLAIAQDNISIVSIEVSKENGVPDGTYTVKFRDNTIRMLGDGHPNNFTWYLSYSGKRISDYYYSTATSMSSFSKKAVAWPGKVPKGYEKYVTAQLGKEPAKKDRRDDD